MPRVDGAPDASILFDSVRKSSKFRLCFRPIQPSRLLVKKSPPIRPGQRPARGSTIPMKMMRRRPGLRSAGLGLALLALGGCQTWVAGMTLPSGRYLEHPPQYIPPSPPFPFRASWLRRKRRPRLPCPAASPRRYRQRCRRPGRQRRHRRWLLRNMKERFSFSRDPKGSAIPALPFGSRLNETCACAAPIGISPGDAP